MTEAIFVNINGKDFNEADLEDQSKYFLSQLRDLQAQEAQLNFKLHQVRAALKVMTDELVASVNLDDETVN